MLNSLQTGWLSPNGDFYPCGVYEHISLAREILKDENANRLEDLESSDEQCRMS